MRCWVLMCTLCGGEKKIICIAMSRAFLTVGEIVNCNHQRNSQLHIDCKVEEVNFCRCSGKQRWKFAVIFSLIRSSLFLRRWMKNVGKRKFKFLTFWNQLNIFQFSSHKLLLQISHWYPLKINFECMNFSRALHSWSKDFNARKEDEKIFSCTTNRHRS